MFTGIVEHQGRVIALRTEPWGVRLEVDPCGWAHAPRDGDSIAVNGCCLTVVSTDGPRVAFDVIPQTLAVTSLGALSVGSAVNLEHAATPSTFLGGHVVLGHVDGLAEVVEIRTEGEWRVRLRLPETLGGTAVDRGSIALDGVSLTIARVEDRGNVGQVQNPGNGETWIDVCLIPETLARTNLGRLSVGSRVNVEADYLAKLVARQLEPHLRRIETIPWPDLRPRA